MALIELKGVYLSYSIGKVSVDILKGFNLSVKEGEFVAITGPSGSGKTSLLNLIAGFLRQDLGQVLYKGKELSKMSKRELARFRNCNMAMVFQFFNLIPELNALDNVALPLRILGKSGKQSRDLALQRLDEVGLSSRWNHYPKELSGGEQQRVAIARALISDPELIFADEPTGNLDRVNTKRIVELIKMYRDNRTILLATHDLDVAASADRFITL